MDLIRLEGFSEGRYFFTVNIKETTTSPWNFFLSFFFFFFELNPNPVGIFSFRQPHIKIWKDYARNLKYGNLTQN